MMDAAEDTQDSGTVDDVGTNTVKPLQTGKRHFPHLNNSPSMAVYKTNVRRYLPHGYSEDYTYRPPVAILTPAAYVNLGGPECKTRFYYSDSYQCRPHKVCHSVEHQQRPSVGSRSHTCTEWRSVNNNSYTNVCDSNCISVHPSSAPMASNKFTGLKYLVERRNNFPVFVPGDKSYRCVEQSPEFYKFGSTVPLVNFGKLVTEKPSVFVPPIMSPRTPSDNYWMKETRRRMQEEISDVVSLERWRPASPLAGPAAAFGQTAISTNYPLHRRKR